MNRNTKFNESPCNMADAAIADALKEAQHCRDLRELYALDTKEYTKQTDLLRQLRDTVGCVMVDIKAEVNLDDDSEYEIHEILEEIFWVIGLQAFEAGRKAGRAGAQS